MGIIKNSRLLGIMGSCLLVTVSMPVMAAIIGVDIEAGQGSPTNWTSYTITDVGTIKTNLIAEDGSLTGVGFQLDGVTRTQNVVPVSSSVIPLHFNDLTTVCCDILHGGPNPTLATWSGLVPLETYNYWVFTSSAATDTITVTGDTVDSFVSPSVSSASQRINGILGSDTLAFTSYARQVTASATGTINIGIQSRGTPTPSGYALEIAAVPIPTAVWLFGSGLIGLIGVARKKKS